jgi:hypothetical protein
VKFRVKQDYRELRSITYPDVREQLDAIWKGGSEMEKMRRQVVGVKELYPKPKNGGVK